MVECTLSITHCLRLNLQLHTIDLVRTCRISSFCTVAWQLARFQLTRRIARSLGDSWASCSTLLFIYFRLFTLPQKKTNSNCCTAALAVYLLLFSISYYLHSPSTASGARYRRNTCIVDALNVPSTLLSTVGDCAFPVAAARVWNSLPATVTSSSSLLTFRRRLKTELFARSYPDC